MATIAEVLTAAMKDFEENGYTSQEQLNRWIEELRAAIAATLSPQSKMEEMLREALRALYQRLVENGAVLRSHPGVERFTLQRVAPQLRAELDRRILASAQLIKLNRTEMIEKTLRRFSGWATSIPKGGSETVDRRETKEEIAKPMRSLPFTERRVLIDQGHKLNASISAVLATASGAIAARWFSHYGQRNYNYREEHKERDSYHKDRNDKVFLIRNSWAHEQGLVKPGEMGYTDEVDQPAVKIFCRCRWVFLSNLRQLPDELLTAKGRQSLEEARKVTA